MTLTRDSRLEPSEDLGTSDKSLLSASQDFSVIRQTAYVTLISMVLFQLRFSGLAGS